MTYIFPTGVYECGFTIGSIRHTARSKMKVALLPDEIILTINPLVADCTDPAKEKIQVNATIPKTPVIYDIKWSYKDADLDSSLKKTSETSLQFFSDLFSSFPYKELHS